MHDQDDHQYVTTMVTNQKFSTIIQLDDHGTKDDHRT